MITGRPRPAAALLPVLVAAAAVGWTALTAPSAASAPKSDSPKSDSPKSDSPKGDSPKPDTPKAEAPKGETPKDAPKTAVPKGDVKQYTFTGSKVFPGTTRPYWVYVPKQYDGSKPACVHVNQDGIQFNAPAVFDRLIAEGSMPVTIGVFVMHGKVPAADGKTALDRFNRSYEYDGLGDAYARFLLDELLPHIEKEHGLKLSHDGNDRSIGGSSSGAICAFTAAWERPDAFRRVFSAIGTYVGLRGGNEYATLVRKIEPKPIRIFLQDGSKDLNIYGGDWWMANQELQRSLKFAGWEVEHVWDDGGHSNVGGTKVFPEAMKWLWKDWPAPVKAGAGSPQLKEILIPGEDWKLVGEGYRFTEGPCADAKGTVYFNDVGSAKCWTIGADGKPVEAIADTLGADGAAFGPDGRMYTPQGKTRSVVAYKPGDAAAPAVIADGFKGNDIVVLHDGRMYVTDPFETPNNSKVWTISPKGEKSVVDTGLRFANGITVSPDHTLLYVADSRTHWVYSYQIQPDGSLRHKQKYYHLHVPDTADDAGADGLRVDRDGRLWVATRMGLQVCDQAGRVNCIIPTPNGKCSNLTFGGPDFDVVYVTAGDKVYSRKVKVKGAPAFQPPHKPAAPRL